MNNSTFGKTSINVAVNNSTGLQTSVLVGCAQTAANFLMQKRMLLREMIELMESDLFQNNFR